MNREWGDGVWNLEPGPTSLGTALQSRGWQALRLPPAEAVASSVHAPAGSQAAGPRWRLADRPASCSSPPSGRWAGWEGACARRAPRWRTRALRGRRQLRTSPLCFLCSWIFLRGSGSVSQRVDFGQLLQPEVNSLGPGPAGSLLSCASLSRAFWLVYFNFFNSLFCDTV